MSDEQNKGEQAVDAQAPDVTAELSGKDLEEVVGGAGKIKWTNTRQRADGTAAGNVAGKWSLAQGASA
jgi:hypothetical protein